MLVAGALVAAQPAAPPRPVVYSAEVKSIIHPVSAEFMIETIDAADRAQAALVVFTLQTPGGLLDSTRDVVTRMLDATTPVVVFVAPAGARAASAGFILTIAADVAAMAPGTHIGAAHPVSGQGQPMDETLSKKAAQDVAAYTRTLASRRERNVPLAEEAVNESRAFTDQEALTAEPPLIDLVAPNLPDLLRQLEGRKVKRFDGREVTLSPAGAEVVTVAMTRRQRILSAIAHPNIAYLLLSLGMLGLTIELWSPGAVVPGVVGGVSLLLAFFALQLLPVNYAGLLLILLGLLFLALEIKVTSYGLLTVGGAVSLLFGSLMLIDSPVPELRVSLGFVLPMVIGFAAIATILIRMAVAAQRLAPVTGSEALVGRSGLALADIAPGKTGRIEIQGEIWNARATAPVSAGAAVRVDAVDGLTLTVRPE
jgi:membrane-bound serine protease (ClpP class)